MQVFMACKYLINKTWHTFLPISHGS